MADLRRILEQTRTVAVFWANPREDAPAHYVPAYLARRGYRVIPVHPAPVYQGRSLFGNPVVRYLADIDEPVDLVDVFRPAEALARHASDILAMRELPRVVWFQSGLRSDEAAALLEARGIEVVQDRCTMREHARHLGRDDPRWSG